MTGDLEGRLHRAAGSLRESVADVPVGKVPRPRPAGSVAFGVGVGVAAGALVLATATLWRGDDGGRDDLAMQPAADVQALVASDLPPGLEVAWAGQQRGSAVAPGRVGGQVGASGTEAGGSVDTYLYGAESGSAFAATDLVVDVRRGAAARAGADVGGTGLDAGAGAGAGSAGGSGQPVTVRGVTGHVNATAGLSVLRWAETADDAEAADTADAGVSTEMVLASRTLTTAQLVAVADGLVVDGDAVVLGPLPPDLPGPLVEVAHLSQGAAGAAGGHVANWVGYADPDDPQGRVVDVTTRTGDAAQLLTLVWQLDADQTVDVRGREGWLAAAAPGVDPPTGDAARAGTVTDLVWQEASGVLVHVTALGLTEAEVRQVAEGLRSASDQEWEEIEAAVATEASGAEDAAAGGAGAEASATDTEAGADAQADVDATTSPTDATAEGQGGGEAAAAAGSDSLAEMEAEIHGRLDLGPVIDAVEALAGGLQDGLGAATGAGGPTSTSPSTSVPATSGDSPADLPGALETAP